MSVPVPEVPGPAGRLEVRVDEPTSPPVRFAAVVAPPNPELGGTLNDRVVYHAVQGLRRIGARVWRFNFRGVGASAGTFDHGSGELDDMRAVLEAASSATPGVPLCAAGYSFGAYVATVVAASDTRVSTIVAIAPPVAGYDFSLLTGSDKLKS